MQVSIGNNNLHSHIAIAMIITNYIARVIVAIAAAITAGTVGVTLWPFIFISPKRYALDQRLIRHERKHLEQWRRYWIIGFLPVYLMFHVKHGYWNNPLEVEAREAEKIA